MHSALSVLKGYDLCLLHITRALCAAAAAGACRWLASARTPDAAAQAAHLCRTMPCLAPNAVDMVNDTSAIPTQCWQEYRALRVSVFDESRQGAAHLEGAAIIHQSRLATQYDHPPIPAKVLPTID
jgi:hypothetical protein